VTRLLTYAGDVAAILTAVAAAGTSVWYFAQRRCRRTVLQIYLIKQRREDERPSVSGHGIRSIIHLMGNCSMTEAQVLEAAFGNKNIRTWVTTDEKTGRADSLMFQIRDEAWKFLKDSN
jgi:hypothetical protein